MVWRNTYRHRWEPLDQATITVTYHVKTSPRRDPDNNHSLCKGILDGLVKAGAIVDDSSRHIDLVIEWRPERKLLEYAVTVRIEEGRQSVGVAVG